MMIRFPRFAQPCQRARRQSSTRQARLSVLPWMALPLIALSGCTTIGSVMSPYSEKFSCKNSDHGQCIHPEKAYADAVAGRPSKSDPVVTNDRKLLADNQTAAQAVPDMDRHAHQAMKRSPRAPKVAAPAAAVAPPRPTYGNIAAQSTGASTPMLRPSRTLRSLILPYADRQHPERLYMARYIYSVIDRPSWVVGDYLVEPAGRKATPPVLRSARDTEALAGNATGEEAAPLPLAPEPRP